MGFVILGRAFPCSSWLVLNSQSSSFLNAKVSILNYQAQSFVAVLLGMNPAWLFPGKRPTHCATRPSLEKLSESWSSALLTEEVPAPGCQGALWRCILIGWRRVRRAAGGHFQRAGGGERWRRPLGGRRGAPDLCVSPSINCGT